MIVLTPEQMQNMDQATIEKEFPEILLMEEAGKRTAELIRKKTEEKDILITIFCGTGNNGGDGLVVARFLAMWNYRVRVIIAGKKEKFSSVTRTNFELCEMRKVRIEHFSQLKQQELVKIVNNTEIIVDALLGTGIKGEVRGPAAEIISLINNFEKNRHTIFAVDIPSGIEGKSGKVLGQAVKADYTATMAFPKTGQFLFPGYDYCGQVYIVDIGIPDQVIKECKHNHYCLTEIEAEKMLPKRPEDSHKGTFGKAVVIGGSPGMSGAPYLAGSAALKTGTGLVKVAVPRRIQDVVAGYSPETMTVGLADNYQGITQEALPRIEEMKDWFDVVAAGPGMGRGEEIEEIIKFLLREIKVPLVLDADALNELPKLQLLKERENPTILTPHPGEMARLMGTKIERVENNRVQYTRQFATENGVYLLLKGPVTTIGLPGGEVYFNPTGNQGLATAGSGDVLTGIITGLLAQGLLPGQAAVLAPYIHGLAGEFGSNEKSGSSLTATGICDYISRVFKDLN